MTYGSLLLVVLVTVTGICSVNGQAIGFKGLMNIPVPQYGQQRQNSTIYNLIPVNTTATFVNRTLGGMPTGICHKEVPTASLLKQQHQQLNVPAGNGSDPSLSRIQVCCNGYERNVHNYKKCDPICTNECINGVCVAPEQCQCYPDHVRNLAGICVPTCPIGCANGDCKPDGTCACLEGFQLEQHQKFCYPKCSQGCLNGNCTAPETCSCNAGYELNAQKKCVPVCAGGCSFGDCVAPGQCSCKAGYAKVGTTCQAICSRGCINGLCTEPNVCTCNVGWTLDKIGTSCVPHCDHPCLNGVCGAHNSCTCNQGYYLEERSTSKCIPHCPNGCPNGVCSSPNFCICNAGFIKDRSIKGSQACVVRPAF